MWQVILILLLISSKTNLIILNPLKPAQLSKEKMEIQLDIFPNNLAQKRDRLVNIASVPQRSPFRYPGGKTWLIPIVRKWLFQKGNPAPILLESFAGGGIVGLTAAFENLANEIIMIELDPEIAAVWQTVFSTKNRELANKILGYNLTCSNLKLELEKKPVDLCEVAFQTILKNRTMHGGIIANGSGFIKNGENGKGLSSRWYPETLFNRITNIELISYKVKFECASAYEVILQNQLKPNVFHFIDPPYVKAGKRMYRFHEIDHKKLFETVSKLAGPYLMTYDDAPEVRIMCQDFGLNFKSIPMKTTHHLEKRELLISDNYEWLN